MILLVVGIKRKAEDKEQGNIKRNTTVSDWGLCECGREEPVLAVG